MMANRGVYTEEEKKIIADFERRAIAYVGWVGDEPGIGNTYPVLHGTVPKEQILLWNSGVDYWNPLYNNERYAKNTRWGGIVAPPTITDFIGTPSSTWRESSSPAKSQFVRIVGGCKRDWFHVIRPGDRFRCVDKWLGFQERQVKQEPRRFRLFIDTHQREYINQKDETVAVVTFRYAILTTTENPAGTQLFRGGERKEKYKYTDEEREAILRGYEENKRRGADTLYWEDVNTGDELPTLAVGPVTAQDSVAFHSAQQGHCVAFDMFWERHKEEYYGPLEERIKRLRKKYFNDSEALKVIDSEQEEIDLYRKYSKWYGSVFYIMQNQ